MNDAAKSAYRERLYRVCDYIAHHLDEPLTLEKLSAIASSSPYHFHRQFLAFSGQPLYRYIQWLRLRRASWRLAFNPQDKVIDIALDAGFQNPESFSRAFKTAFGKSPRQFRQQPDWLSWHQRVPKMTFQEQKSMDVKIVDFPQTPWPCCNTVTARIGLMTARRHLSPGVRPRGYRQYAKAARLASPGTTRQPHLPMPFASISVAALRRQYQKMRSGLPMVKSKADDTLSGVTPARWIRSPTRYGRCSATGYQTAAKRCAMHRYFSTTSILSTRCRNMRCKRISICR